MTCARRTLACLGIIAIFSSAMLFCQTGKTIESFRVNLGLSLMPQLDSDVAGKFSTIDLSYVASGSLVLGFPAIPALKIEPALTLGMSAGTWYNQRAYNAEITFATANILAMVASGAVLYRWQPVPGLDVELGGGPALNMRFAIPTSSEYSETAASMNTYYWDGGRFLMLLGQASVEYEAFPTVHIGFALKHFINISNLWTSNAFMDRSLTYFLVAFRKDL